MQPSVDEVVAFSAAVSAGTAPYNITWDFGDGSPKEYGTLNATHAYTAEGVYAITFTVVDGDSFKIIVMRAVEVLG